MISFKRQPAHLMTATALAALLCAAFAPAQAGLLGGTGGARALGTNGQLGVQLGGSSGAGTNATEAPLRKLSNSAQRGQAATGDAVDRAKGKAETTGQTTATAAKDASTSTRSASIDGTASAEANASAQTGAGTKP